MPDYDQEASTRTSFLPFALPSIGDEEIAAVTAVLRSGPSAQPAAVVRVRRRLRGVRALIQSGTTRENGVE